MVGAMVFMAQDRVINEEKEVKSGVQRNEKQPKKSIFNKEKIFKIRRKTKKAFFYRKIYKKSSSIGFNVQLESADEWKQSCETIKMKKGISRSR